MKEAKKKQRKTLIVGVALKEEELNVKKKVKAKSVEKVTVQSERKKKKP